MSSSNSEENNENLPPNSDSALSEPSSSKKRKLSTEGNFLSLSHLEFEVLQIANKKLTEFAKQCEEKMIKMELKISMLQKENVDLQLIYNESSKVVTELNSNINELAEKNKILVDKNQELESKIKEKVDEVSTMKTIKKEIKDSVENERETTQESMDKLKAEINDLKKKNIDLEKNNKERFNTIELFIKKTKNLEIRKKEEYETFKAEVIALNSTIKEHEEKEKIFEDQIKVLNGIVNEYEENMKILQDENKKLEEKCKEHKDELSSVKESSENLKQSAQETIDRLKAEICDLNQRIVHLTELNLIAKEDAEKIKILEEKNQELKGKNKKLMEEVTTMKTVKSEIKDSVENERKTYQETINKLKAEINDPKNKHNTFEEMNQKNENILYAYDLKSDNLQKQKEAVERKIEDLKNELVLAKDLLKAKGEEINALKKNEEKITALTLKDVTKDDGRINLSLLSCRQKILNCQKMEGETLFINFYPNCDESAKAVFLGYNDFRKTCFKININGELIIRANCETFEEIMSRISSCQLFKLHLCNQEITYNDYLQLTSSKEVKICILEKTTLINYNVFAILKELPKIQEFQYEFCENDKQPNLAQQLGKELQPFFDLEKFELLNLNHTFKLGEFFGFIKKNANACYSLKFRKLLLKSMQKEVEKNEKVLINSLKSLDCNISIEYNKL